VEALNLADSPSKEFYQMRKRIHNFRSNSELEQAVCLVKAEEEMSKI
jgi:hypothetical protein